MSFNVCHVSVQADDDVGVVDLALPARLPVASLIPDIVRLSGADAEAPGHWQLATMCGTVLDGSVPLQDQDVRDGDLLLLSAALPRVPAFERTDPITVVLAAAPPRGDTRALRGTGGLSAAIAGALALAAGPGTTATLVTAAVLMCVVAGVTVGASRSGRGPRVCAPLGCITVFVAAICAALAVPGPLDVSHALLGSAAAAAVSLVLLRIGVGSPVASTASACGGLLCAAASAVAVLCNAPRHSVGVVLAVFALGALSLAPRLSVLMSGLAPAPSLAVEVVADADRRAAAGHRILIGLVIGGCVAASIGTVVVGVGCLRGAGHWLSGAAFCAVVGSALAMRARCYAAGRCRWSLMLSGICSVAMSFVLIAAQYGHWAAGVAVCAGVTVIVRESPDEPSPIASRAAEVFEYAVLAAVVPVACAALDVFNVVRTSSLI
jgi:type VII secretion integral membrane protein EccD